LTHNCSPFLCRAIEKAALFRNGCKTHSQTVFDPRNRPTSPRTVATTPPINIYIDLSVAEPVKNREISELDESYALMPKIKRRMPPARTASEIALFIDNSSFDFPYFAPQTSHTGFLPLMTLTKITTMAITRRT